MVKPTRIIFLDFDDIKNPLLGAGQSKATLEVGKRLVKKGHEITVLCSRYPGSKDRKENGLIYKHVGIGSNNIRLNNLVYILSLPFNLRNIKADIIIECFTAPISTLMSPLWTKIPVVAVPTSFEAERFSKLYKLPFEKIENFGLKFYKYFLPYTPYFENKMKRVNPNVISKIVPEGVGGEFFKIKREKPKHILFLGRYDMGQKGIDLLLRSYAKVADKISYPLIMAGKGPDEQKMVELIKNLKLQEKVKVVGPAYGSKKSKLLSEAVFVAFSSRHEGFSLFALEALAAGVPLVAFDIHGLSWADSGVCLKAKKFNLVDYSKLLLKCTDLKVASPLSKNARNLAKKYTWENVAAEFDSFIKFVLKREKAYAS